MGSKDKQLRASRDWKHRFYPLDFIVNAPNSLDLERTPEMVETEVKCLERLAFEKNLVFSVYATQGDQQSQRTSLSAWGKAYLDVIDELIQAEIVAIQPVLQNPFTDKARDIEVHAARRMIALLRQEMIFSDLELGARETAAADKALICQGRA
ncbi:hypothetical protein PENSPDRAFT_686828 [Peniophora sp. CONT]|nr:hypothetical protein PENSPDRAFT_686828 [Peniophora sp. CONT]